MFTKTLDEMSKDEKSLLLFLETCAVDHGGLIDIRHMNSDDIDMAKYWNDNCFIYFGRIISSDIIDNGSKVYNHWCQFTEKAFELAHQERTNRAIRLWEKRKWHRTIDGA